MLSIRLFTGLSLPPDIIANLEALLERLQPLARINWVSPANLHITTKFIGDWQLSRTPELSRLLAEMPPEGAIPLAFSGLEFFPHALVVSVTESAALQDLAARTDAQLRAVGIRPEARAYRPHVTLARIPGRIPLDELRAQAAQVSGKSLGSFVASEFHLYQSHMSTYRPLSTIPLTQI